MITVRRSKVDQQAAGFEKAIPSSIDAATCLVRAIRAWLKAAAITEGRLPGS